MGRQPTRAVAAAARFLNGSSRAAAWFLNDGVRTCTARRPHAVLTPVDCRRRHRPLAAMARNKCGRRGALCGRLLLRDAGPRLT